MRGRLTEYHGMRRLLSLVATEIEIILNHLAAKCRHASIHRACGIIETPSSVSAVAG